MKDVYKRQGHMFQYSFMYENQQNLFRNACIDSSAYVEGYAVYAQYYAYNYLKDIDQNLLLALKENELASYNMIILADIGIHYEGWSLKDFKDHFNAIGFQLSDHDAMVQYSQLQANPCAFEPYYVGYEEIASLKEKAVKKDVYKRQAPSKTVNASIINTRDGKGICVYLFMISGGMSIPPVLAPVRKTQPTPIPIKAPP